MSNIYVISETFFSDEYVMRRRRRPFGTIESMDETIIDNINDLVAEDDTLFHLGDFGGRDWEDRQELIHRILCKNKILIMGNCDRKYSPQTWRDLGFTEVSRWPIIILSKYILSYETTMFSKINSSTISIHGKYAGSFHYKNSFIKISDMMDYHVGVDVHSFRPIPIDYIGQEAINKYKAEEPKVLTRDYNVPGSAV